MNTQTRRHNLHLTTSLYFFMLLLFMLHLTENLNSRNCLSRWMLTNGMLIRIAHKFTKWETSQVQNTRVVLSCLGFYARLAHVRWLWIIFCYDMQFAGNIYKSVGHSRIYIIFVYIRLVGIIIFTFFTF